MIQTAGLPSGSVFPTGTTAIQYTATDSCGNKAYCNFDVTVTDGQTPTITCPPDVAGVPADPGECFATNVPLGLPIYGDNCPGATVHSDAPAQFPVGPTIVTYTVTDAGGLSAECSCTVMITDTEPPAITACPPDRTVVADLQEVAALPDLTAEVLATSNCPDVVTTQSPAAGTLVAPGLTVVTVTVTDGAGLTDSCDVEITVVSQQLALLAGQECYRVGDSVTVEVWMRNIVAQVVGAQFFLEYDAGKLQLNDGVGAVEPGDPPLNVQVFECSTAEQSSGACNPQAGLIDYAVGIPFPPAGADVTGDWKLAVMHFTALSETCGTAGLVTFRANLPFQTRLSTQNGAVLVVPLGPLGPISIDSTSPTIVDCVSGLAQDADPGECSAVVAWPEPTATDDCGTATITQTAGPPSGSAFAVGTTVIQYTAADLCGNESQCVFNVTVTDQQPPAISCPPDIAGFPTDPGQCYATNVPLGVPIYSDNCPGVTVYNDAPPQFPVGPTVVTYTATDAAGHTAQCSVTVTVVDNEPPVIEVCPAERTLTEGDLLPDLTGEVVATDNCGASLALAQDPPAGTVLPLGEHSVLMTVTDGAGLTATCSVTIHVVPQPNGACCLHGNGCQIRTEQACTLAGGIYKGDDVPCTPSPCAHPGDLNCDGSVDFKDINPFVLYLSNFSDWQTTYAGCPPENGDTNGDGTYPSFRDINPFVALLSGGG